MKRLLSICLALILVIALFTAACAEGIQFEQPDVPVTEDVYASLVSESADELGEIELPTPCKWPLSAASRVAIPGLSRP